MKIKHALFSLIALASTINLKAQWVGPTNGTLLTNNKVQITNSYSLGTPGSPPPPPIINILSDDIGIIKQVFAAGHSSVDFYKPAILNNVALNTKRNNGAISFQLMPVGSLTLNTDGNTSGNRGLFLNSNGNNFFSLTETEILFKKDTAELFKVKDNGHVYARKVIVTLANPFPDYVFEADYKLTSLANLEAFIKLNKHLPNMPSQAQIQNNQNQVDLGELQAKLLEKVEELTLYILQQQKEIEALKLQQHAKH